MTERTYSPGPNAVQLYLNEIGQHPLLTYEQEQELGAQIQIGFEARKRLQNEDSQDQCDDITRALCEEAVLRGREAFDTMYLSNLRLVVSIARKYTSGTRGMELLDLIQEGNLGLYRAVEKFDPSKGFKFSTYASFWIRQGITRSILDKDTIVRIPAHVGSAIRSKMGLDVPLTKEELDAQAISRVASYDQPLPGASDSEENSLLSLLPGVTDEADMANLANKMLLEDIMGQVKINEREVYILTKHFGLDGKPSMTLEEIAQVLGITRQAVQQIESRVLGRCRTVARKQKLAL